MGIYRYFQDGDVRSHSLAPDTIANQAVCLFLNIPANSSIEAIEEAFSDNGWWFEFEGDRIIAMSGDDDSEIPNPEDLESIASIFTDGSWVVWEENGEHTKILFQNGQAVWGDDIRRLFPAETFMGKELDEEIKWVAGYLKELRQRKAQI